MRDAAMRRWYNIIVGLEFGLLAAGAALLGAAGLTEWIAVCGYALALVCTSYRCRASFATCSSSRSGY